MSKKKLGKYPDLPVEPPEGKKVYFMNEKGQNCDPHEAFMYTFEGAETWHYIKTKRPE